MRSDRQTYIGLDVVRFLAALTVTVYHLAFLWWLPPGPLHGVFPVNPVRFGYVGVPVFFVLSGFIIAASALGRTARDFLRGRALRLYPAAWICVPITVAVAADQPDVALRVFHSLVLWPTGPWVEDVYWTLGVEIAFYLIIAAALAGGIRLSHVGWTFGGIGSAFWILRAIDFAAGQPLNGIFAIVETSWWGGLLVTQACFFGVGMVLWTINRKGLAWHRVLGLGVFVLAGCIATYGEARFQIANKGPGGSPIEAPLIWLSAVVLIVASIRLQPWIWQHLGRWGPLARTVGLATYPLYLVHNHLGRAVMLASGLRPMPSLLLGITVCVAVCFIVVMLERYPRSLLRQLLSTRSLRALPASDLP
jgi:peptidoglycan/LPS O-acetylase OafA/YrhL